MHLQPSFKYQQALHFAARHCELVVLCLLDREASDALRNPVPLDVLVANSPAQSQ